MKRDWAAADDQMRAAWVLADFEQFRETMKTAASYGLQVAVVYTGTKMAGTGSYSIVDLVVRRTTVLRNTSHT